MNYKILNQNELAQKLMFGCFLFVFSQQYIHKKRQYNKITANSMGKNLPKTQLL